ncbi:MAG: hypothetical protein RPS47_04565 [Colwellia sp.]
MDKENKIKNDSDIDDFIMNDQAFETNTHSNISEDDSSIEDLLQDVEIHHEESSNNNIPQDDGEDLSWLVQDETTEENEQDNDSVDVAPENSSEIEGDEDQHEDEDEDEDHHEEEEEEEEEEDYSEGAAEKAVNVLKDNAFNIGFGLIVVIIIGVVVSQALKAFGGGDDEHASATTEEYMNDIDEDFYQSKINEMPDVKEPIIVPHETVSQIKKTTLSVETDKNKSVAVAVQEGNRATSKRVEINPSIEGSVPENKITDSMLANKNTKAIMLIASKLQEIEKFNSDIKKVMRIITKEQKDLVSTVNNQNDRIDSTTTAINRLASSLDKIRTRNLPNNSFQAASYPRKSISPIRRPRYAIVSAVKGVAYVKSRVQPGEIAKLVVGTNLIGYGKITAINGYGDIMTVNGKVKRAQ